ncbi:MAG: GNAT family N-acetyltransferase [Melioribacteraceae bacterium]|nr:GNAT family N-acetyltransferase [Melioribacteraceae bacterium]
MNITYRKINDSDREWIEEFIKEHWRSGQVVVHKTVYAPGELQGFVAQKEGRNVGLITYVFESDSCEIVTLNSVIEDRGIGSHLVDLVKKEAITNNCGRLWLVTTNDNIKCIYFYQRLCFRLTSIFPNAVDYSRKIKPDIPMVAENGLPIRDELEFTLYL